MYCPCVLCVLSDRHPGLVSLMTDFGGSYTFIHLYTPLYTFLHTSPARIHLSSFYWYTPWAADTPLIHFWYTSDTTDTPLDIAVSHHSHGLFTKEIAVARSPSPSPSPSHSPSPSGDKWNSCRLTFDVHLNLVVRSCVESRKTVCGRRRIVCIVVWIDRYMWTV